MIPSRRELLTAALLGGACSRKRASGYPGWAVVALQGSPSLAAVDLLAFKVEARIPLSGAPSTVFAHPHESARVLALCPDTHTLEEFDLRTFKSARRWGLPGRPTGVKPAPGGESLWILQEAPAALRRINLRDGQLTADRIELPSVPVSWDVSPRDNLAAIAFSTGQTALVDLVRKTVVAGPQVGADPGPLAFRSDGNVVVAANRMTRQLTVFEHAAGRTIVELPLALRPDRFCLKSDGGQLFVTGEGYDAVAIAYPYRTEIAQTSLSGRKPSEMACSDAPPLLFVSNPDAGSVTAFDVVTQRVVAVIGVGLKPGPIVITPDQQYALVLHRGEGGEIGVIRIASISSRRTKSAPLFTMIPVGANPAGLTVLPS